MTRNGEENPIISVKIGYAAVIGDVFALLCIRREL